MLVHLWRGKQQFHSSTCLLWEEIHRTGLVAVAHPDREEGKQEQAEKKIDQSKKVFTAPRSHSLSEDACGHHPKTLLTVSLAREDVNKGAEKATMRLIGQRADIREDAEAHSHSVEGNTV